MTAITVVAAIIIASLSPGETMDREGWGHITHGQGWRNDIPTGPSFGLSYIGPQVGPGNVTLNYDQLTARIPAYGIGYRIEQPLTGQWSWASEFGVAHVDYPADLGRFESYGSETLFTISASLIYQASENAALFIQYEHMSHGYLLGDRNPGSNVIGIGFMGRF